MPASSQATTVQISREASKLLDSAAKSSGMRKHELADMAIRFFYDPEQNPGMEEAFRSLASLRENALAEIFSRVGKTDGR